MRIVSLQPSVSITLERLGCLDSLVACTRYCLEALPALRERKLSIVQDSWTTTTDELSALEPNLVIASVPYRNESLAAILKAGFPVLALAPHSISDIYNDIRLIASLVNARAGGEEIIASMQNSIAETDSLVRPLAHRPRVYCEEWGKPLIHSQNWVKELVEAAGGEFLGAPGAVTTAESIAEADPDVIVMAWCGAGDRVPLERTVEKRSWRSLRAVRNGHVFCITDELLNTPAPTLIGGLQALATAIHPEVFGIPHHPGLRCIEFRAEPSKLM
jgi:iron complex transport system substrate-binding protein